MRYLIFGTGDYYNRYKKWFDKQDILALLDNSEQKQHTLIDGIEVLSPEEGVGLKYDSIVILSFHVKQMKQQLVSLGVDEKRIYHFYDLHQLVTAERAVRPVQYFGKAGEIVKCRQPGQSKIVLLSHDLTLGGPAIALSNAAKVLNKQGYMVVFASMTDGALKEELLKNDIPVIVDENLQVSTMQETEWIKTFSLIICNTLNFHVFLSERDMEIPVIWWLHDARFFYDGVNRNVIGKICLRNLSAVSVGPVPAEAVREFLPDMACDELLYGVAEVEGHSVFNKQEGRIRFITIGFLEERKGQDILLQAIKKLPDNIRSKSEFYLVGHDATMFGERIRRESSDLEEIAFMGSVGRERIHELLNRSDILICPSREDPMPTVAAEAMMHSVPCIVSDATGTAAYIRDGEDGFIFQNGNVQMLAEQIEWCVANKEKLCSMGMNARQIYDKHFSMDVFKKALCKLVGTALDHGMESRGDNGGFTKYTSEI